MLEFFKIASLPSSQKYRKVLRLLERIEHSIVKNREDELLNDFYIKKILDLVIDDLPIQQQVKIKTWMYSKCEQNTLDVVNQVRHRLYLFTGSLPAEWDLILPQEDINTKDKRNVFKNLFVYAEDIRTPFNIGSIFRTAEAFGVEKIFISPDCISPESSKAKRSAMGCVDFLPWERCGLDDLPKNIPLIALETGKMPITEFTFPKQGILMIGSEELGLSPEALNKAGENIVTIPMQGIKASINVGVAFGICMQKWTESL